MARPKKELQENAEGLGEDTTPIEPTAAPAKVATKPNYNTEYAEYHVKVQPHFRRQSGGGNEIYKYTGTKGELIRDNIRIEAFRANALNDKWYSRKQIFIEKGSDVTTFEFICNPE